MKKYILLLIVFCSFLNLFGLEREYKQKISKEIIIDSIQTSYTVLDEWKNPGLYAPANMFDGDINTCFAEGHVEPGSSTREGRTNSISLWVEFKNPVYIDEIRIMNGFGKNDTYFKNNNRIKKLLVNIPPNRGGEMTLLNLEDKREFQSFKFDKSYLVQIFYINNDPHVLSILDNHGKIDSVYKGDKYDDTCITEIEFYNQGKKIPVKNIKEAKKNYLLGLKYFLEYINIGGQSRYKKYKWKVEDYKLYKYKNGNWLLTKYFISGDDSIETFDEYGNCNQVTHGSDSSECYRFDLKKKK